MSPYHLSRLTRRYLTHSKYNTSRRFDDGICKYLSSFYNNYTNTYYNANIVQHNN